MNSPALAVLVAAVSAVVAFFVFVPPIPQDPAYHLFADSRTILGVPNFWNVLSNLPFLVVGSWGLVYVFRHGQSVCIDGLELPYIVFFAGVLLTAFGSGYYHLHPANEPLVWDRLPMTIAFAGLFSIITGEFLSPRAGRAILVPLIVLGALSVEYWAWTEAHGVGDLRAYAVFQFVPLILIPFILLVHKPLIGSARYYWVMFAFYVLAKVVEFLDAAIFSAGALISGHTLKHVLAALGSATLLYALAERRALNAGAADG